MVNRGWLDAYLMHFKRGSFIVRKKDAKLKIKNSKTDWMIQIF